MFQKYINLDESSPIIMIFISNRPGVRAAKAAGMEVVAVPSIPKQAHLYTEADTVLSNLFDLRPEHWGLPPFDDCNYLVY